MYTLHGTNDATTISKLRYKSTTHFIRPPKDFCGMVVIAVKIRLKTPPNYSIGTKYYGDIVAYWHVTTVAKIFHRSVLRWF
jgi:hypothetical protein